MSYRGKRRGAALFACSEGQARAKVKLGRKAARRLRRSQNARVKLTITTAAGKSSQTVRLRHGVTTPQASSAAAWWTYYGWVPQSAYNANVGVRFGWRWDLFARWDYEYGAGFLVAVEVQCDVQPTAGHTPTGECWQIQSFKVWLFDSTGQIYGPYGPFWRYFDWNRRWG